MSPELFLIEPWFMVTDRCLDRLELEAAIAIDGTRGFSQNGSMVSPRLHPRTIEAVKERADIVDVYW